MMEMYAGINQMRVPLYGSVPFANQNHDLLWGLMFNMAI